LIEGRVGRGTIVRSPAGGDRGPIVPPAWDTLFAARPEGIDQEVRELVRLFNREDLISLAAGLPAPDLYPIDDLRQIFDDVLAREGASLLHWCPAEGYPPLRRSLSDRFPGTSPDEVLILSGSTQGIFLITQALVEPGDLVIVPSPTYLGAIQALRSAGARIASVPVDERGLDLDMLASALARTRPKFIYCIPTFQNPTGATLDLEQRKRLLELAHHYGVPIVEDDPYALLRFDGDPLPTLKELDVSGEHVLYLSTYTKILFPGLRVGWLVAPRKVVERLTSGKHLLDLFTNPVAQAAVHEFDKRGFLEDHLRRVRGEYRIRRDAMGDALRRHCPKLTFAPPDGGYFFWCRLPRGIAARELLRQSIDKGVSFVSGEIFSADGRGRDRIRLSYVTHPPDTIEEGVRRLGAALRQRKRKSDMPHDRESAPRPIV